MRIHALAGITLATGVMYLRILAIVAVFNLPLGRAVTVPLLTLSASALLISALQYRIRPPLSEDAERLPVSQNPLELGAAMMFAVLFVLTSILSSWVTRAFGIPGVYSLAAIIGVTDIDPFVLNLAQGSASGVPSAAIAGAILIATSSNGLLKAMYAVSFAGGRATAPSAAVLVALALGGIAMAIHISGW
jgi:uncharacterized membrane protein (DUF4010 family)